MTSKNFTIDNVNPLIQYSPLDAWTEGSKTLDPLASSYSNNGTFTLCTTQGSSATFTFNGTRVYVFGAKRPNHGPYSITLDGVPTLLDGFSNDPVFGTLFVSDVLPQAQHKVTLTNQVTDPNKQFLDLDFITWTTTVSDQGESKTLEDTAPAFTYQPSTSWNTDLSTSLLTGFSGNNGHFTGTAAASATISFSGNFITVFGAVGPTISAYTVELDGVAAGTFNGTKAAYTAQVALYAATGLGAGQHTLQLTSKPAVGGQVFAVDFAQVSPSSTVKTGNSSSSASPTPSGTTAKKSSSLGPAIGGAVAGVAVLGILIFLIFFLCRRRRREREPNQIVLEDKYSAAAPMAAPYPAGAIGTESRPSHVGGYSMSSGSQMQLVQPAQYAQYGNGMPPPASPPLTDPYGGMASPPLTNPYGMASPNQYSSGDRRTFYTVNDDPSGGSSDGASSVGRSSTVHSSGAAGLGAGGYNLRRSKGGPLPLPPTANVPLPPGAERMYVPGREQDGGPLPPDYEQATESYERAS
ncbi:hypothetical protein B0H19DRAFT_1267956 [Mycena capillaripes]|nr:hypothetical protein B0H19DRAFT_1267956 [Mycena capillaripes]